MALIHFGEELTKTADYYDTFALRYHITGDFFSSLKLTKLALDIRIAELGEEHPKTADSYHSLGVTLHSLGDFIPALQSDKRALEIRRKIFGEEHFKTAESYYSLGVTQHSLGDFLSALESNKRALNIRLKIFGEKHLKTAESYYSLGVTQSSLGDFISALKSNKRALDISLKLLGEECPKGVDIFSPLEVLTRLSSSEAPQLMLTANNYYSLGVIQHSLGDFLSALESAKRSLEIRLKMFGLGHSKTADSYYSLGVTQFSLGDVISALRSNKQALDVRLNLFGEDHPKVADCFDLLGLAQQEQGDFSSALGSNKRALDIRRKMLGEEHPKTADSYYSLGVAQHKLQDFVSALDSKKRALDIRLKLHGVEHPKTADSFYSLGVTQSRLGDFVSALELKKRALDIRLKLHGEEQPNTAESCYSPKASDGNAEAVKTINYEGGLMVAKGVQLVCPYGAIGVLDDPVLIKLTLEDPSTHCDMIVANGLKNDIMFIAPIINLQPNDQAFEKPVVVTTKLAINNDASLSDLLILHGTQLQAGDGKIIWENVTHESYIDLEKKELEVKVKKFSRIATFLRLTSILAKDVITRVNLLGFSYTLTMLFKDNHPRAPFGELALVFMSHDVYHEKCYREDPSSFLMKLKDDGFQEVSSIDKPESDRIYNNESLTVSVLLGEDYKLTGGQQESRDFIVESSVWWNTGHVIKLSLKGIKDTKILCGKIAIEGQHGHILIETFCDLGE